MLSAAEVTAMFRGDLPDFIIGTILCTTATGVALFSPRYARRKLIAAALFAFFYGARMLVRTASTALLLGDPPALPYLSSALEYLVPIPASIVFVNYLGNRLRRLNQMVVIAFCVVAAVAIPYEIVTRRPHAANSAVNAVVILLMAIFLLNYITQPRLVRNIVSAGALIFGIFVINEHFRLVPQAPLRLTSEPFGFLIFVGTIVYDLLRRSEQAARRMAEVETELATARRIQESILPTRAPSLPAIDVASAYIPASSVAGDYFDYLDVDEHCLGVVVADVSGHGVGAALVASMLKVAIAMESPHVREPALLLQRLNEFFCGRLARQFITAVVAFIDTRSGQIAVASAGHPPPLVRRRNGTVEEIATRGFVLGRMRHIDFETASVTLAEEEAVVFYTDGVTEARRGEEMFGEERLKRAVACGTARNVTDAITGALASWTTDDDVTVVVVRRSGEAPPMR